jgi:hypothetical protein
MTRCFIDTEFTGLHKNTTLISLGLVTDTGQKFYAEFNDYDKSQCDEWINTNVINKLYWNNVDTFYKEDVDAIFIKNDKTTISKTLITWLNQFKLIEFWGDVIAYDWVLFMDLLGNGEASRFKPRNFNSYQAHDIFTALLMKGINPKANRYVLLGLESGINQHNCLNDAEVVKMMYDKYLAVPEIS